MKKINTNLVMVILFFVFMIAPISDAWRYFLIAIIPFVLGIKNALIVRDQIFYNIENKKFAYFEKKYGTKKAFFIYLALLVFVPILFAIVFVVAGIQLL